MQITESQRKAAKEEARRINMEASASQDAGKLIRGFDEFDTTTTGRRGVWELIQNACDLAEHCEVTVDFRNGELAFSHNGIPFTTDTLTYLIKQSSSKSRQVDAAADSDTKPTGRFGTGFITTHAYGRKLRVRGSIKIAGLEVYAELRDFLIDRSGRDVSSLTKALAEQLMQVENLSETETLSESPVSETVFRYHPETPTERANILQAWNSLLVNTPYVMALNQTLRLVRLIDEHGNERVYRKRQARQAQEGYWQIPIECDGEVLELCCLYEPYGSIQVVAPIGPEVTACELGEEVPRLFLYFPLIGSERWGCNFIVHSNMFAPRNERDGVHIIINDQTQHQAINNQALLKAASETVFSFLEEHLSNIHEPLRLAHISFTASGKEEERSFRGEMQQLWRERLSRLPLVETDAGNCLESPGTRLAPIDCYFLKPELVDDDPQTQAAIQYIAVSLWPDQLPKKELARGWAQTLDGWQWDEANWISAEKIAEAIEAKQDVGAFDLSSLLILYRHLKAQGESELFERFALLPDRRGKLKKRNQLQRAQDLLPQFIQVLESVVPEALEVLLDERFTELESLSAFTRRVLAQQVNDEANRLLATSNGALPEETRNGLLLLCSIFPAETQAVTGSLRWRLMPLIHKFYNRPYERQLVPNVAEAEEIRYDDQPLKNVVRQFFIDFRAKYESAQPQEKEELRELLRECLELLSSNSEMRKDLLAEAVIIPNQLEELRPASALFIEKDFGPFGSVKHANQLKNWAQQITEADYRGELAHPEFVQVVRCLERPEQDGRALANRLEGQLADMQLLERINDHPKQAVILDIIQNLNGVWEGYFVRINGQKATITLNRVSSEELKESLFGIMTLPDKQIEDLGRLAKVENLSELLDKAQKLLNTQIQQAEELAFKKLLGEKIEVIIKDGLEGQLQQLEVTIDEQQNGQDMVVKLGGVVVYQIEVKSRWDKQYTTTLSYRQLSEAVKNPERYALCSVDLVDYRPSDGRARQEIEDINQILEFTRFVPDIGKQIKPLVGELKRVEFDEDAVRLADEFRVVVPQRITRDGMCFGDFIKFLLSLLHELKHVVPDNSL